MAHFRRNVLGANDLNMRKKEEQEGRRPYFALAIIFLLFLRLEL